MKSERQRSQRELSRYPSLGMYGLLLVVMGLSIYLLSTVLYLPVAVVFPESKQFFSNLVWGSGMPIVLGIGLFFIDLRLLYPRRRKLRLELPTTLSPIEKVTVVLTALNDEDSVGPVIREFLAHPNVKRVILVDNSSEDKTAYRAERAGAQVFVEELRGYGHCVHRALTEGAKFLDTDFVALCEADGTFTAGDIEKFLAYAGHSHVVLGTRIVELLREDQTQLTNLIYWGNFFAAKVLEFKHLGRSTLTDLGTTYKICRSDFLRQYLGQYNPRINLEFNAHFIDVSLGLGSRLVETPLTFSKRVGESKGGNKSNSRALAVGSRMLLGIVFGWQRRLTLGRKSV